MISPVHLVHQPRLRCIRPPPRSPSLSSFPPGFGSIFNHSTASRPLDLNGLPRVDIQTPPDKPSPANVVGGSDGGETGRSGRPRGLLPAGVGADPGRGVGRRLHLQRGLVSVGIAIALNQYYGPQPVPGAGIWLSTLLAALGMLAVAATFYCWSVIFPARAASTCRCRAASAPGSPSSASLVETVILLYYAAFAGLARSSRSACPSFFATVGVVAAAGPSHDWAASTSPAGVLDRRPPWCWPGCCWLPAPAATSRSRRCCSGGRAGTLVLAGVLLWAAETPSRPTSPSSPGSTTPAWSPWPQNGYETGSNLGTSIPSPGLSSASPCSGPCSRSAWRWVGGPPRSAVGCWGDAPPGC